jgi:Uncharacterized protein conserved in bacteria (DUF2059)
MVKLLIATLLATTTVSALGQGAPQTPDMTALPPTLPVPDEAKLAISRQVAARLVPDGVFMKVMSGTMDSFMGGMMDQMLDVPIRDVAAAFVKDEAEIKAMGEGTIREVMTILDPAYKQRADLGMKAMFSAMGGIMTSLEPEVREGMAIAYANRFTAAELTEFNAFFASPSGQKFAAENMTIMTDPALMQRMQSVMPKVLEALPEMVKRAEAATADLPKRRKPEDLSKAERARLAELLGVNDKQLRD